MTKTAEPRPRNGETLDTFYRGRVRVFQKKRGYRFSVDAPLLADFVRTKKTDDVLDIGTGSGIISLLLSLKPFRHITALEIQKSLADMARRNVALNGLGSRIDVIQADFRDYDPGRKLDLIVSNPPYIRRATGFLSRVTEKSVAKHEIHGELDDLIRKTAEWLKRKGRACFIYPERRREDLAAAARANGLRVRRIQFVHPRAGEPANLFLAELGLAAGPGAAAAEPKVTPALVLFGTDGKYTDEAEAIFSGRPELRPIS
ncbi:MAG: methyltransferase [Candidatus Aminicenantales bacterium]|jgi:tRNA1(Val) A37 N6-methylase TrmN6